MILSKEELKTLEDLTQIYGPSGDEKLVKEYLKEQYLKLNLEVMEDNLGSIIALKKGKKENAKKVFLVAHMDEVGFMVRKILPNGAIMVLPLGGHNPQAILSNRVILKTQDNRFYKGLVNALPPHLMKGRSDSVTQIDDMVFDFGFTSKKETEDAGIRIGDTIICEGNFQVLNDGRRLLSKAFDDRLGLSLGLEVLKALKDEELDFDLYVGGSVQEEVGCRGALTSSFKVHPDLAIVVDCSPARDSNGDTSDLGILGQGVLIRVTDGNMIAFKDLISYQVSCLERAGVKYQYFISPGGTDAGNIHKQFDGIKTMTYCLCARNIHTPSTLLDSEDYLNAIKGLIFMLKDLSEGKNYKL